MGNVALIRVEDHVVDGVRCRLRSSGATTAREAVVFVHGNPGSSEDWTDLLQRTGVFARAIAPDFPGFGHAERSSRFEYSVPGYAQYLSGVLAALHIERVHLVLHDFGGPWGLEWAAAHPNRVASFTFFNTGILPGYRWHKYARIWRTPIAGELFQIATTKTVFKTLLNWDNPVPLPHAFTERMYGDYDAAVRRAVLELYRATPDLSALTLRHAEVLRHYRIPTLVLWGDGDKYLPVRFAQFQSRYFDAQTHILSGSGHWPMVDQPERVREVVLPFLWRQTGRGQAEAGEVA